MNLYILLLLFILFIISISILIVKNKELFYNYLSAPVVSKYQNYDWYTISNPNLGFAPAVHFMPPSRKECLQWINQNFTNPDEAYTKFIECLQNVSSKVWIKNLPIQSPGTGEQ